MNNSLSEPYRVSPPVSSEILLIVAEPGLAKTDFARRLLRVGDDGVCAVESLYLAYREDDLISGMEQLSHSVRSRLHTKDCRCVGVLIDGFPALSEDVLTEVVRRLRAFAAKGCPVVITLRPEGEQLVDVLPEARVVRGSDLLYALPSSASSHALSVWQLCNGLPYLVGALPESGIPDRHYLNALSELIVRIVRPGIPQAEREARLGMLLLGRGTLSELEEVAAGADAEMLAWLEREAPFFGINLYADSYCCAALSDDALLRQCYTALRRLDESFTEVISRSYEALVARRTYARAGICCSLVAPDDRRSRLALRAGVELALAGSALVVSDAVSTAVKLGLSEEPGYVSSRAALQILEEPYEVAEFVHARLGVGRQPEVRGRVRTHLALLMGVRGIDAGHQVDPTRIQGSDRISQQLLEHMAVRCLLAAGRPSEALERLLDVELGSDPSTVPEALLASDLLVAYALCTKQIPDPVRTSVEQGRALLERSGLRRLATYQRAAIDLAAVICGQESADALDRAAHQAEESGDTLVSAVCLLAKGVSSLRQAMTSAAHVCFEMAAREADRTVFPQLRAVASLLDALTLTVIGEEGRLSCLLNEPLPGGVARDVTRMLLAAHCDAVVTSQEAVDSLTLGIGTQGEMGPDLTHAGRPSRDAIWLVSLVASEFGFVSERFSRALSDPWRYALQRYGTPRLTSGGQPLTESTIVSGAHVGPGDTTPARERFESIGERRHAVRICLLGGFRVSVNGRPLLPDDVRRRRAGSLVALLAAHEDHAMRRSEIIGDIWGRDPYGKGLQRLYEATSSARDVFGTKRLGVDLFVRHKGQESLGLNLAVVEIDADEFEQAARLSIAGGSTDEEVVENATLAFDLYAGDLDQVSLPRRAWVRSRRERLRERYVDAMVAGSRSALRLGRFSAALGFAQAAAASDGMREDVVAMQMRCLAAVDRTAEVREVFERYSYHATALTGAPPSTRLRRLAMTLAPSGQESNVVRGVVEEDVTELAGGGTPGTLESIAA